MKCPKCSGMLVEKLTKAGVLIDVCKDCNGYWLDHGEFNFFCKSKQILTDYERNGLANKKLTTLNCPKCDNKRLMRGRFRLFRAEIEECPSCHGLFFDKNELKSLSSSKYMKQLMVDTYKKTDFKKLVKYPPLFVTSLLTILLLYTIVFIGLLALSSISDIDYKSAIYAGISMIIFQFFLSPFFMDFILTIFNSLKWYQISDLPKGLRDDIQSLCKSNKIPLPEVGIINDGTPTAYTYGRTPWSARLILSRGLIDILDAKELKAVVAHELGHIKHWDFVVMTAANVIPIILYSIFERLKKIALNRSTNKNKRLYLLSLLALFGSYMLYKVSQYIVLYLSRVREYYADSFSAKATKDPNSLLKALAKIGLGISLKPDNSSENKSFQTASNSASLSLESLNIINKQGSDSLALAHGQEGVEDYLNNELKQVMRWDLWNPWATYYEIHSTHPLTAKRIVALSAISMSQGQEPYVQFDLKKPSSFKDSFYKDLLMLLLPYILAFVSFILLFIKSYLVNPKAPDIIGPLVFSVMSYAIGGIIRLNLIYPGKMFVKSSVLSLLKKINVSPVQSYPVKLEGTIIGRGNAGSAFDEDMMFKDQTGIIFLNHEHSISNFYFAFFKFKKFKDRHVEITGWYRRNPTPQIEIKKIKTSHTSTTSFTKIYKIIGYITFIFLACVGYLLKDHGNILNNLKLTDVFKVLIGLIFN